MLYKIVIGVSVNIYGFSYNECYICLSWVDKYKI